jgi:hypothetical protein
VADGASVEEAPVFLIYFGGVEPKRKSTAQDKKFVDAVSRCNNIVGIKTRNKIYEIFQF